MSGTELLKEFQNDIKEELLWAGKPKQGLLFTTQDFFLLPFSMFGCGFAYFLMTMPSFMKVSDVVVWIGAIVMLLSIYFFIIRFPVDANYRSKITYAFSNDNFYIKVGNAINKIPRNQSSKLSLSINDDGSGIIWFLPQTTLSLILGNSLNALPFVKHPSAFLYIPDVKNIFEKIISQKAH